MRHERPARRTLMVVGAVSLVAYLLGGVLAAGLWAWFADPPYSVVDGNNAYQDSPQLGLQFGIDLAFAAACLVVAVPLGAVIGLLWHRLGWQLAVVLAVAAALASLIAWQLGAELGPDDPRTLIAAASDGDRLYQPLEVRAKALLLSAPAGALAGFIAAVLVRGATGSARVPGGVGGIGGG